MNIKYYFSDVLYNHILTGLRFMVSSFPLVTAEVNPDLSREAEGGCGQPRLLSPRNYGLPALRERCVSASPIL